MTDKIEEEFNLSEKIDRCFDIDYLSLKDVREFIKRLKDLCSNHLYVFSLKKSVDEEDRKSLMIEIDKLAGDNLA